MLFCKIQACGVSRRHAKGDTSTKETLFATVWLLHMFSRINLVQHLACPPSANNRIRARRNKHMAFIRVQKYLPANRLLNPRVDTTALWSLIHEFNTYFALRRRFARTFARLHSMKSEYATSSAAVAFAHTRWSRNSWRYFGHLSWSMNKARMKILCKSKAS